MPKVKTYASNYWDQEKGEVVEFGNSFVRCYDKAGKLQFGTKYKNKAGEDVYQVKFVIDRQELFADDQAASYLRGTIDEWEEMIEAGNHGNLCPHGDSWDDCPDCRH